MLHRLHRDNSVPCCARGSLEPEVETVMSLQSFWSQYWPLVLIVAWFVYKLWASHRVRGKLPALRQAGAVLVDVRSESEFASAHAPGSVNIPLSDLSARLSQIPGDVPVVLCCAGGSRSGMASLLLRRHGFKQIYNVGAWGNLVDD